MNLNESYLGENYINIKTGDLVKLVDIDNFSRTVRVEFSGGGITMGSNMSFFKFAELYDLEVDKSIREKARRMRIFKRRFGKFYNNNYE